MLSLPRSIYVLAFATALLSTAMPFSFLIGGIVGMKFSSSPNLATLPLTLMVVGVAVGALPASKLFQRYGYKVLFFVGVLLSYTAILIAIFALQIESFELWILAMFFTGLSSACAQQMRFTASLFVNHSSFPIALSVFMLSGVLAAIIGPEIATRSELFALPSFVGAFIVLAMVQLLALAIVQFWPAKKLDICEAENVRQPQAHSGVLAIAASVTGFGIMSFLMTATPVSMHEHHGHTLSQAKLVIQWHILAMFLPSLFTGKILQRLGIPMALVGGMGIFAVAILVSLTGTSFHHYALGLVLIGLGWNILFTGGSSLAAEHIDPNFKGRHDTVVFAVQAATSLAAGLALFTIGWHGMQWLSLAALLPLTAILLSRNARLH